MNDIEISLKLNQSATVFNDLKVTQRGVSFISSESLPLFESGKHYVSVQQKHKIKIHLDLECFGLLSHEIMTVGSGDSEGSSSIEWQGYLIQFNGLNGYTEAEVSFTVKKLPESLRHSTKRPEGEKVNPLDVRDITVILPYGRSVTVFDTFMISLVGVRAGMAPGRSGVSGEEIQLVLNGFNELAEVSITTANDGSRSLEWHGFRISYLSHSPLDVRLAVEEIPG